MNLTLVDIKKIPPQKMTLIFVLMTALLGYFYYFFLFQPAYQSQKSMETKLAELETKIRNKTMVVNEVERNKRQMLALNESLQTALTRLPDHKEIPGLLSSVSEAGRSSGLDFVLFEPVQPVHKEFYAEIPVKITISGGFHDTAIFFEKLARLPRIVNIDNISMGSAKEMDDFVTLTTSCMIKTYMFVEKASEPKNEKKK